MVCAAEGHTTSDDQHGQSREPDCCHTRAGSLCVGWAAYPDHVADLPDGRDRWIRWDQELTTTCPECGRPWADHPGGFELKSVDGHLGRVLPQCEAPGELPGEDS
jgi:hypothetical protein